MLELPDRIDLESVVDAKARPDAAFFIDSNQQLLVARPYDPNRWHRRVWAAICGACDCLRDWSLARGWLPIDVRANQMHFISSLRKSLIAAGGFNEGKFDSDKGALLKRLVAPKSTPLSCTEEIMNEYAPGLTSKMRALALATENWIASDDARALGYTEEAFGHLRSDAVKVSQTRDYRDRPLSDEWVHSVIQVTVIKFKDVRNLNRLSQRLDKMAADRSDPSSRGVEKTEIETRVRQALKQYGTRYIDDATFDRLVDEAYVQVRSELLAHELGIELAWAQETVRSARLERQDIENFKLPVIEAFPSDKEAAALLKDRKRLHASSCAVAEDLLLIELEPKTDEPKEIREALRAKLKAQMALPLKRVARARAQEEELLVTRLLAKKLPAREVLKKLIDERIEPDLLDRLRQAMEFDRSLVAFGVMTDGEVSTATKLHESGLLPLETVALFGAAAKALRDVLECCARAPKKNSSSEIFESLYRACDEVDRFHTAAKSESAHGASLQLDALIQVAVQRLISRPEKAAPLPQIVRAFSRERTGRIWRALRSPQLRTKPLTEKLEQMFSKLSSALAAELDSRAKLASAGAGKSPVPATTLAADMKKHIEIGRQIVGAELSTFKPSFQASLRKCYGLPEPKPVPAVRRVAGWFQRRFA